MLGVVRMAMRIPSARFRAKQALMIWRRPRPVGIHQATQNTSTAVAYQHLTIKKVPLLKG